MAKHKARVVWLEAGTIPKPDEVWIGVDIYGDIFKDRSYIRFVESPPRKKARKKK